VNARRRGALDEAETLYRRALAILDRRVEPEQPNLELTRRNLGRLLEERKKAADPAV
jgi:hypothetical protein